MKHRLFLIAENVDRRRLRDVGGLDGLCLDRSLLLDDGFGARTGGQPLENDRQLALGDRVIRGRPRQGRRGESGGDNGSNWFRKAPRHLPALILGFWKKIKICRSLTNNLPFRSRLCVRLAACGQLNTLVTGTANPLHFLCVLFLRASSEPMEDARQTPKPLCGNAIMWPGSGRRRRLAGRSIRRVFARIGEELEEFSSGGHLPEPKERCRTHGPLKFFQPKRPRRDGTDALSMPAARSGPVERGPQSRIPEGACRDERRVVPCPMNPPTGKLGEPAQANVNFENAHFARTQSESHDALPSRWLAPPGWPSRRAHARSFVTCALQLPCWEPAARRV